MHDQTWLPQSLLDDAFGRDAWHPELRVARLPRARMLWLNRRVARQDPAFAAAGGDFAAYERHLLRSCAFAARRPSGDATDGGLAIADRYGGVAIGRNGGSGRAGFINGYHVKGIGRTPLVGRDSDQAHSSGGAYLEECVREVIASEIADAELPHGAVPILAIIDTGEVEVWQTDHGPKTERRCLLVRPPFLRPAHFMRAPLFATDDVLDGRTDAGRVAHMFVTASAAWSDSGLARAFRTLWSRWARQLAHGYVARLAHGGGSSSNIALDARLLDFGGVSALPDLARYTTMQGECDVGEELSWLFAEMERQVRMFRRFAPRQAAEALNLRAGLDAVRQVYLDTVYVQLLRLVGFDRDAASRLLKTRHRGALIDAVRAFVATCQERKHVIFDAMPEGEWTVPAFWDKSPPPVLARLRRAIDEATSSGGGPGAPPEVVQARHRLRSCTRVSLFRDPLKAVLYQQLDGRFGPGELQPDHVSALINAQIASGRRDGRFESDRFAPLGFCRADAGECMMGRVAGDSGLWAVWEWCVQGDNVPGAPVRILSVTDRGLALDGPIGSLQGAVCMA